MSQQPGRPAPQVIPEPRTLPRLLPTDGRSDLDAHFQRWGQLPGGGPALIDEVARAGLRGRGGAAFPTATKLRTVSAARRSVVVANGTEGEPASAKDKALLVKAPHLVLDGVSLAADCVGATEGIVCLDRAATAAVRSVTAALAERLHAGADRVPLRLLTTPIRYVAGEESALVHWLNGGPAKPTFVPPRPYERGVQGRPTLVNNVETLAHVALIARFGADWFGSLGQPDEPGTALVTLAGDVTHPGVYEFPYGVGVDEVLRAGGVYGPPQAVLLGGYSGTWISGEVVASVTMDAPSLRGVHASLGCGAICVIGAGTCGLAETASVAHWLASQSAGQCGPCTHGLPAIAEALDALVAGDRGHRWERHLRHLLDVVDGRGACHHPDGTVRFVRSALSTFSQEIDRHRRHEPCRRQRNVLPTPEPKGTWR